MHDTYDFIFSLLFFSDSDTVTVLIKTDISV